MNIIDKHEPREFDDAKLEAMAVDPAGSKGWPSRYGRCFAAEVLRQREGLRLAAIIIQRLLDVQNGCPLPKYQDDYDIANFAATEFLKTLKRPAALNELHQMDQDMKL